MNIEGLSETTLEKLIGHGWIHTFADLYDLEQHRDAIIQTDGFGEKSFERLRKAAAAHWQNSSPDLVFRRLAVMPDVRLTAASAVHGKRLKLQFRKGSTSRSCRTLAL